MSIVANCRCGQHATYIHNLYGEGFMDGVVCTACNMACFEVHAAPDDAEELKVKLIANWNKVMGEL